VDAFATPFVQGQLRHERLSITVESECVHCGRPMTIDINSNLEYHLHSGEDGPIVFVPEVNVGALEAPSIIEDF
jgi:hypothetical protein